MTGQDLREDQGNKGRTEFEKTPTPMTRFNVNFSEVNIIIIYASTNTKIRLFYRLDFLQSLSAQSLWQSRLLEISFHYTDQKSQKFCLTRISRLKIDRGNLSHITSMFDDN